jgi:RND family efflux transporter MFP subunit
MRRSVVPDPLSRPLAAPVAALVLALASLAGCDEATAPAAEPVRPVRVAIAETQPGAETASLTGTIEAAETAALAFRTGGRLIERAVGLGDRVETGQLIGTLESETQRNALQAARAELTAALGEQDRAEADYERQAQLLERGFTTRQRYDVALQTMRAARSAADAAKARLATAEEQLAFTELYADGPGVVTVVGAEPGEVVAAGQMVVTLAREGGRDAVFDAPERLLRQAPPDPVVTVALTSDPAVRAEGRVREVAPQADPVTRTFRVRVGLDNPPEDMRLGSTVTGEVALGRPEGIELPASALVEQDGRPAVFVFDAESGAVSLRPVAVARFDLATVIVADGLVEGEAVVTAGVQALRPGQQVRLAGAAR